MADFEVFVAEASPALLRLAFRLTGDRQLAEDLLQAALWRVVKHWEPASNSPIAYARQVLVNLATDGWRKRRRLPSEVMTGWLPDAIVPETTDAFGDRQVLVAALRALPRRQRTALVLRYWEDLSVEQTAQLMGCSAGTVKSTCSKGLQRLRGVLEEAGAHR